MCSELAINVTRYLRPHSPRKSTQGLLLSGSVDVMEGLVYCSAVAILKLCLTWPVLFAGPARSCSSGVAVRELQQVQADTPVTHVSLSKAGFCPGWDQRAPLSLSSSLLASQSILHLLVTASLPSHRSRLLPGTGTGEEAAVSLTGVPSFLPSLCPFLPWPPLFLIRT